MSRWSLALVGLFSSAAWAWQAPRPAESPFKVQVQPAEITAGQPGKATVVISVGRDAFLYRDMTELTVLDAGGLTVGPPDLPPGLKKMDPTLGVERETWDMDAWLQLPVSAPKAGHHELQVELRYQGCKGSVCFMPTTERLSIPVEVVEPQAWSWRPPVLLTLLSACTSEPRLSDDNPVAVEVKVEGQDLLVDFQQAPGWHLTEAMTSVDGEPGQAGICKQHWPQARTFPDPTLPGEMRGEYDGQVSVRAELAGPAGTHAITGSVTYQACKAERCLMPQTVVINESVALDGSRPRREDCGAPE